MIKEAEFLEKSIHNYYTARRYVRDDRSLQNSSFRKPRTNENGEYITMNKMLFEINERVIKKHVISDKRE